MLSRVCEYVLLSESQVLKLDLLLLLFIHKLEWELENLRQEGASEHLETTFDCLVIELLFVTLCHDCMLR